MNKQLLKTQQRQKHQILKFFKILGSILMIKYLINNLSSRQMLFLVLATIVNVTFRIFRYKPNFPMLLKSPNGSNVLNTLYKSQNFNRSVKVPILAINNVATTILSVILQYCQSEKLPIQEEYQVNLPDGSIGVVKEQGGEQTKKPIVLINHNIGGTNEDSFQLKDRLLECEYTVLFCTRRGYDQRFPSKNGTFTFIGLPHDTEAFLSWVSDKYKGRKVYMVGFSGGSNTNFFQRIHKGTNSDIRAMINVSHVHNERNLANLSPIFNTVMNSLKRVVGFNQTSIEYNKGSDVFAKVMNSKNMKEIFTRTQNMSDFKTESDMSFSEKFQSNHMSEDQIKNITKCDQPIVFIDGSDDPFMDQSQYCMKTLGKFIENIDNALVVRHKQGSHVGFVEGYFYGEETFTDQVFQTIQHMEEYQENNEA